MAREHGKTKSNLRTFDVQLAISGATGTHYRPESTKLCKAYSKIGNRSRSSLAKSGSHQHATQRCGRRVIETELAGACPHLWHMPPPPPPPPSSMEVDRALGPRMIKNSKHATQTLEAPALLLKLARAGLDPDMQAVPRLLRCAQHVMMQPENKCSLNSDHQHAARPYDC